MNRKIGNIVGRISAIGSLRLFALGAALAVASHADALEKVVFAPQWHAQSQFAGYFVAKEKGFYKDEGLDVKITFPTNSISSYVLLKNGECQFTTIQLLDALKDMDWGMRLVNLMQTSQHSSIMIVGRDGKNPMKLKGKRVGKWNAGFSLPAMIFSKRKGLDYKFVRFTNNVSLFLSGAIDATLVTSYNEYYQLKQANITLNDNCVLRLADHGFDLPEDGLYVTRDYYNKNKTTAEKFAKASKRGWLWCHEHPEEALEIVMKYVKRYNIPTNRILQKLMLKEVLRLQNDTETTKPSFVLKKEKVEEASRLLIECDYIDKPFTYNDLKR